jgi:hypothetical protein
MYDRHAHMNEAIPHAHLEVIKAYPGIQIPSLPSTLEIFRNVRYEALVDEVLKIVTSASVRVSV